MAYGVVRLTLYALIVAIEADLRECIVSNLLVAKNAKDLFSGTIFERAHTRLLRDFGFAPDSDGTLIEYLDFSECIEVLSAAKAGLAGPLAKATKRIVQSAPILVPIRNRVMHSRPLEYDDLVRVSNLVSELMAFPTYLFPTLRQTEEIIKKDPTSVLSLQLEEMKPESIRAFHNLPIPDFDETGFIGR